MTFSRRPVGRAEKESVFDGGLDGQPSGFGEIGDDLPPGRLAAETHVDVDASGAELRLRKFVNDIRPSRIDGSHAFGRAASEHLEPRHPAEQFIFVIVETRTADDPALELLQFFNPLPNVIRAGLFVDLPVIGFNSGVTMNWRLLM